MPLGHLATHWLAGLRRSTGVHPPGHGALMQQQQGGHGDVPTIVPRPMHERDPCIASMRSILTIAQGVARGMAYMHSLQICHGDLKCENVLLSNCSMDPSAATAKVGDFGLSRAMGDGNGAASHLSTATVGTVTHMPPELLLSGRLRPSCDVYSFGIMLWQLYTGAVPYAGMRYAEIVYKVAVCNMRPVFPDDTPSAYRVLAEECWQSDAAARPSFEQVVERLQGMLDCVNRLVMPAAGRPELEIVSRVPSAHGYDDITLLSPWIAACPHTGSSNGGFGGAMAVAAAAALGGSNPDSPVGPSGLLGSPLQGPTQHPMYGDVGVTAHVMASPSDVQLLPQAGSLGAPERPLTPTGSSPMPGKGSADSSAIAAMGNYLAYRAGLPPAGSSGHQQ
uniref:Protein kinase domain-containing protein n=1 Tax=Chlamydomonas leiostraca TaxID=1034604 RepID=A0A7S0WYY2_9CHLO|mmetsp:Transcript_36228/g.91495  ORF Transcript_36228/g.91495 Transcript_36228/m.91495 type:complete len:392 (+) Transcript_36228:891-2066(+)